MQPVPTVKIEIYIPESYIEQLRDQLHTINVGHIGNYDHCMSITAVRGYWRPLPGAAPYNGKIGAVSEGTECKVEVIAPWERVRDAVRVTRHIHPYDEPLINIIPLANHLFSG